MSKPSKRAKELGVEVGGGRSDVCDAGGRRAAPHERALLHGRRYGARV